MTMKTMTLAACALCFFSLGARAQDEPKPADGTSAVDGDDAPKADAPKADAPEAAPTASEKTTTTGDPAAPAGDAPSDEPACSVAVMNFQAKGLPPDQVHVAEILADSLAAEVAKMTKCRVITQADIVQMLDFEATKAATCDDGSASCLAEIGGALGVERVVGGTVGQLGDSFKLQVKLQNVDESRIEARVDELVRGDPEALDLAARNAGRKLFGFEPLAVEPNATSQDAATEDAASGGILGTVLIAGGVGIAVAGILVVAAAIGYNVLAELVLFPSATSKENAQMIQLIGFASIVAGVAGGVFALVGGGVATAGFFVE